MIFNLSFDSSVSSAPAGFRNAVNAAATFLQTTFTDNVTINVTVGYGEVGGLALSSGSLGESLTHMRSYSYSQVRTALSNDALSPDDHTATTQLPVNDPAHAGTYSVSTAEAKALGLSGASTAIDGSVGFSANDLFDFTAADGISAGHYDFYGVVVHELTEIMGRSAGLGEIISGQHSYSPMDLFRFSSQGVRDFSPNHSAFLSPDGGTTHLVSVNTDASGDFGDWASNAGNDAFLAFAHAGVVNLVTSADLRVMDLIGWNVNSSGSPTNSPGSASPTYDSNWTLGAVADFNSDHRADLIWSQSGMVSTQMLDGSTEIGQSSITTGFGADWRILGAGDFNGDGNSDLAWVRSSDGMAEVELFNGTAPAGGGVLSNSAFNTWSAVGIGDFNQDGRADLIFQRPSDGVVEIQLLNGTTGIGAGLIANTAFGLGWHIVAAADVNGDHSVDLLWQRQSDGLVEVQLMSGMSAVGGGVISNNPFGAGWTIAGTEVPTWFGRGLPIILSKFSFSVEHKLSAEAPSLAVRLLPTGRCKGPATSMAMAWRI
jgi:hypothetical protein